MIGSGAWACATMSMVAKNVREDDPADVFVDEVPMWVYEEDFKVSGSRLALFQGKNTV